MGIQIGIAVFVMKSVISRPSEHTILKLIFPGSYEVIVVGKECRKLFLPGLPLFGRRVVPLLKEGSV